MKVAALKMLHQTKDTNLVICWISISTLLDDHSYVFGPCYICLENVDFWDQVIIDHSTLGKEKLNDEDSNRSRRHKALKTGKKVKLMLVTKVVYGSQTN